MGTEMDSKMEIDELFIRMDGLVVFRNLLEDEVVSPFAEGLFGLARCNLLDALEAMAEFEQRLFAHGTCWTDYLLHAVLEDENVYVTRYAAAGVDNAVMEQAVERELEFLGMLGGLGLDDLLEAVPTGCGCEDGECECGEDGCGCDDGDCECGCGDGVSREELEDVFSVLPRWEVRDADFASEYADHIAHISTRGYGMFASHTMFSVDDDGCIVPVKHPDMQTLDDLPGYEREREKIIENTEALLAGLPANNILLYGDAGTGKSSAVKAIVNEYSSRGLRLVEIKKSQLFGLPEVLEQLSANPLKFVIFIDDLSFTTNDKDFAALKAILEGSVFGRSGNIVVYATSNRRHLIKETMEDRAGTDIHESDTRQELMSLSARFGLVITFMQPDRKRYSQIVLTLAEKAGIEEDEESLIMRAERFAIRAGGRSPRAARQFVDLLRAGVEV